MVPRVCSRLDVTSRPCTGPPAAPPDRARTTSSFRRRPARPPPSGRVRQLTRRALPPNRWSAIQAGHTSLGPPKPTSEVVGRGPKLRDQGARHAIEFEPVSPRRIRRSSVHFSNWNPGLAAARDRVLRAGLHEPATAHRSRVGRRDTERDAKGTTKFARSVVSFSARTRVVT